jgi:putative sulfotransferase
VSVPTFIVGTGRCGSTMLSNMLREHPHVLSLSEIFALVYDPAAPDIFPPEPIDGRQFWAMVAGLGPFIRFMLKHGLGKPELLYPFDAPSARFSAQTGVPAILLVALPHLTEHHEALFDVLQHEVTTWPRAPVGAQYRRLFGWLQAHFGKRIWIERSGFSHTWAEQLLAIFPDARIVHMVRDGRDTALSMQAYVAFRLLAVMGSLGEILGVNPLASPDRSRVDRLPAELRPFLPEHFDLEAFRAFRPPLPVCGGFWAQNIESGLKVLSELPADRLLTLRYEHFFVDPTAQLDTLAAFLGDEFVDEAWSTRCAAAVRPPRSSWRELPEEDARALTEACRPGFERLRAAGVRYDLSATERRTR